MLSPKNRIAKAMCLAGAALVLLASSILPANAQGGNNPPPEPPPKPVGWEVRSTNTPGGGGELQSQGVTGEATPWYIVKVGPTVAGTAVINLVITYYGSKEDLERAKEIEKKKQEEEKKKKEEEKKKKEEEKKKKKGDKPKPATGPDVPTYDPRTHELKDGKVVPKDPKRTSTDPKDHKNCDMPQKFECSEHWRWWLENHDHRNEPKDNKQGSNPKTEMTPMGLQSQPRILVTGSVVAGEEATIRVVDGNGAFLSGMVVALPNGEQVKTDENGKATIKAPNNTGTLLLTLLGTGIAATSFIRPSGGGSNVPSQPHLDPPSFIQPGIQTPVNWSGVTGDAGILIDGKPAEILASSPTGCIVMPPKDLAPGTHTMTLTSGGTAADVVPVDSISLSVEPPKTMIVGQPANYKVHVLGTDQKMNLSLNNLNGSVAGLSGESADGVVTSSGGKDNRATVNIQTRSAGQVMVSVSLLANGSNWSEVADELSPAEAAGQKAEAARRNAEMADYFANGSKDLAGRTKDKREKADHMKECARQRVAAREWRIAQREWLNAKNAWEDGKEAAAKAAEAAAVAAEGRARDAITSK